MGTGLASALVGRLEVPDELVDRARDAFNNVTLLPGKMPSSRVALSASSYQSFFPTSTSMLANFNNSHATSEFSQTSLQLRLIELHRRGIAPYLLATSVDEVCRTLTIEGDRLIVSSFVMIVPVELSKSVVTRSNLTSGQIPGDRLAVNAEPGRINHRDLELSTELVQNTSSQCLLMDILCNDD